MDLQPYLSFDDGCCLAIKVEKQLKYRKPFQNPFSTHPQSTTKGFSFHNKLHTTPTPIKVYDKGKGIANELPRRLEGKKWFKFHVYGHFQVCCPNWRTLTIMEVLELQAIKEETSEEEFENEDYTLVTKNIGELLVI